MNVNIEMNEQAVTIRMETFMVLDDLSSEIHPCSHIDWKTVRLEEERRKRMQMFSSILSQQTPWIAMTGTPIINTHTSKLLPWLDTLQQTPSLDDSKSDPSMDPKLKLSGITMDSDPMDTTLKSRAYCSTEAAIKKIQITNQHLHTRKYQFQDTILTRWIAAQSSFKSHFPQVPDSSDVDPRYWVIVRESKDSDIFVTPSAEVVTDPPEMTYPGAIPIHKLFASRCVGGSQSDHRKTSYYLEIAFPLATSFQNSEPSDPSPLEDESMIMEEVD